MYTIQEVRTSSLNPWDDNPRFNDNAVDAVAKSIENFGFNVPIICDQHFTIIAGHTRWKAAKKIGMELVPVIILELNENQRKAFAIADNKTARIAEWDYARLCRLLDELQKNTIDLSTIGYSKVELQALLTQQKEFNWNVFEKQFEKELNSIYVLFPVKLPVKKKIAFKKAINKFIHDNQIKEKDSAKAAGQAISLLLGV